MSCEECLHPVFYHQGMVGRCYVCYCHQFIKSGSTKNEDQSLGRSVCFNQIDIGAGIILSLENKSRITLIRQDVNVWRYTFSNKLINESGRISIKDLMAVVGPGKKFKIEIPSIRVNQDSKVVAIQTFTKQELDDLTGGS